MANITINTPAAAQYGRAPDGAEKARDAWWAQMGANDADQAAIQGGMSYTQREAANAQNRGPGATEDPRLANQAASGANGHQNGALYLAQQRAMGNGISPGAMQLQAGLNQAMDQQTSMGRSGRGGAAIATGEANAGYNNANMQQTAYTQAGALKAREMAEGRGMYGTIAGQAREQSAARLGMANELSQGNAQLNDRYGLGMAQANTALGNAGADQSITDFSNYQQGMNPVNAQSQAYQQYQAWRANANKQKVANNSQEDSDGWF